MRLTWYITALILGMSIGASAAYALPPDPWKAQAKISKEAVNVDYKAESTGEVLPVDPWARARRTNSESSWIGSGNNGKLNYSGEATTYTEAKGQEMIAPAANSHNALVMTEHLRRMGYQIPQSLDDKIRNAPENYGKILRSSYDKVYTQTDPLSEGFTGIMSRVEDGTGFDMENLLFNSVRLLSNE